MKHTLECQENLSLKQALIDGIIVEDGAVQGVRDQIGAVFTAQAAVMTAGTFLHGLVHIGESKTPAGRAGEFPSNSLADNLASLGFTPGRMKTGTPARIKRDSIDFSMFTEQHGDEKPRPFSHFTKDISLEQISCYIGHTNKNTHEIIRKNIKRSPLYSGAIKGVSARYCPSLEDKIVKFSGRDAHQIILEPEGLDTDEWYASGLGNSLPYDIQIELVHSIPGLNQAEIMRPAYAIEYDFIQPTHLLPTLETKLVRGLYFAGQVNGTSGYEEAAAQGLWAGINAARKIHGERAFLLDRSEAYMAVMIDDLVNKGTNEPYRMFTSRAEYRLLLREDNADLRLLEKGYTLGLHDKTVYDRLLGKQEMIDEERERIRHTVIKPSKELNTVLATRESTRITKASTFEQLLKRPQLSYDDIAPFDNDNPGLPRDVNRQVEIQCKYEGYISRHIDQAKKFQQLETITIPDDIVYDTIPSLSTEIKQKLSDIRPVSLGQASRIPGITPAAVSVLMVYLKHYKDKKAVRI